MSAKERGRLLFLDGENSKLRAEIEQLEKELSNHNSDRAELQLSISELQTRTKEGENGIRQQSDVVKSVEEEVNRLQKRVSNTTEQLEGEQWSTPEEMSQCRSLLQEIQLLRDSDREIRITIEKQKMRSESDKITFERGKASKESELHLAKCACDHHREPLEQTEKTLDSIRNEYVQLSDKYEQFSRRLEEMRKEREEIHNSTKQQLKLVGRLQDEVLQKGVDAKEVSTILHLQSVIDLSKEKKNDLSLEELASLSVDAIVGSEKTQEVIKGAIVSPSSFDAKVKELRKRVAAIKMKKELLDMHNSPSSPSGSTASTPPFRHGSSRRLVRHGRRQRGATVITRSATAMEMRSPNEMSGRSVSVQRSPNLSPVERIKRERKRRNSGKW